MKDLKSQLSASFGATTPTAPEPAAPAVDPALAEGAWWTGSWALRLGELLRRTPGAPKLNPRPPLGAQRQATDQLVKVLKKAGRNREAAEIAGLRDAFLARRSSAAWSAIKRGFGERGLSEKVYRRLKQEEVDPVRLLERLGRLDPSEVLGAERLYEALATGK